MEEVAMEGGGRLCFCDNLSMGILTMWPLEVPTKILLSSIETHLMEVGEPNVPSGDFFVGESGCKSHKALTRESEY